MGHELRSSFGVDLDVDLLSLVELKVAFQWSVKNMENTSSNLNGINYVIFTNYSLEC